MSWNCPGDSNSDPGELKSVVVRLCVAEGESLTPFRQPGLLLHYPDRGGVESPAVAPIRLSRTVGLS